MGHIEDVSVLSTFTASEQMLTPDIKGDAHGHTQEDGTDRAE